LRLTLWKLIGKYVGASNCLKTSHNITIIVIIIIKMYTALSVDRLESRDRNVIDSRTDLLRLYIIYRVSTRNWELRPDGGWVGSDKSRWRIFIIVR